jgi:hypothetical protein
MLYKHDWLKECYQTLLDCENYPMHPAAIVSPFHCKNSDGVVAPDMHTVDWYTVNNDRIYEIKTFVSGNTWFMRGDMWLNFFDFYPTEKPSDGRDWQKLHKIHNAGYCCAVTPREMAYKHKDAIAGGKYDVRGHWH